MDLIAAIQRHARAGTHPAVVACWPEEATLSYRALWELSGRYMRALSARGICPGDRVAVSMANRIEVVVLLVALMRLGCIVVPLVYRALLRDDSRDDDAVMGALRCGQPRYCIVSANGVSSYERRLTEVALLIEVIALEAIAEDRGASEIPAYEPSGVAGMFLQFSSGSTGTPKGIYLTRRNVSANVSAIATRLRLTPNDRVVSWLPLYHDMGLIGAVLCSLWAGSTLILLAPHQFVRAPLHWLEVLTRFHGTVTMAPQFAYDLCLAKEPIKRERIEALDLSTLRVAINGGEFVNWPSCQRFTKRFKRVGLGPHVLQPAYGMAENCVAVTLREPGTAVPVLMLDRSGLTGMPTDISSIATEQRIVAAGNGSPVAGTLIRIKSDDGQELGAGKVGGVYIAGESTTTTVYGPDAIAQSVRENGWLQTGDVGLLQDGELYIIGRVKEVFKFGGRTFIPADLESTLIANMGLAPGSVAAVAVYDVNGGKEDLVVFIELASREGQLGRTELIQEVRLLLLRHFRIPVQQVMIVKRGAIPRTTSGKIRRVELRRRYARTRIAESRDGPLGG